MTITPFTVIKGGRRAKPRRQPPSEFRRLTAEMEERGSEMQRSMLVSIMRQFLKRLDERYPSA